MTPQNEYAKKKIRCKNKNIQQVMNREINRLKAFEYLKKEQSCNENDLTRNSELEITSFLNHSCLQNMHVG